MTDREAFEAWWGVKYVSQSLEEDEAWAAWQAALAHARQQSGNATIYAWLGFWRDKMPAEAVSQLQDILGPLAAAPAPQQSALERFNKFWKPEEDGNDPIERLRFFCSLAMQGQDWLDVEPFFDALTAPQQSAEQYPDRCGGVLHSKAAT